MKQDGKVLYLGREDDYNPKDTDSGINKAGKPEGGKGGGGKGGGKTRQIAVRIVFFTNSTRSDPRSSNPVSNQFLGLIFWCLLHSNRLFFGIRNSLGIVSQGALGKVERF